MKRCETVETLVGGEISGSDGNANRRSLNNRRIDRSKGSFRKRGISHAVKFERRDEMIKKTTGGVELYNSVEKR